MKKGLEIEINFMRDGKFDDVETVEQAHKFYFQRFVGMIDKTSKKAIWVKNSVGSTIMIAKSILVELDNKNTYKAPQWASK